MSKHAQLHDGTVLEFPDNTPDEVIDRTVKAHINAPANDSAINGVIGGALKPFDNATAALMRIPGMEALDSGVARMTGLPSAADAIAQNQAARGANTRTGWQGVGNIIGTLPLARLPGGLATQGAAGGALLSDASSPGELARDTIIGGVSNLAGGKLLSGLGSAVSPQLSAGLRRLNAAGISLTPGQILADSKGIIGKGISKAEEALTSVPFLGDAINMARNTGTEDFNRALGSRALGGLGLSLPKGMTPGPDFVEGLRGLVGKKYQTLVPKLATSFDQQFAQDLAGAKGMVATLPNQVQKQFEAILRDTFTNRSSGSGIAGQALKDAESRLTALRGNYAKSGNGDHRVLADALGATRQALRDLIDRSNPAHSSELQALNKAWAQLKPMQAASDAAADGIITAKRMYQAVRKGGFPDPLTRTAATRLPSVTPDSGTAKRAMTGLFGTALGSGAAGSLVSPALALPALGAALYTKAGMKALNKAVFAARGPATKAVGEGLRTAAGSLPGLGPTLLSLFGK